MRLAHILAVSTAIGVPAVAHANPFDGAVFTSTNAASGNAVAAFQRTASGALVPTGTFATGGTGTSASLGSQGAVTLAAGGRILLVVNAGSNDVSSFFVDGGQLWLLSRVSSGGVHPISVAARGDLVYVLNDGDAGNISALRLRWDGTLEPIADSSRALGSAAAGPAQVAIAPDGDAVVVTEKATSTIAVYRLHDDGLASDLDDQPSSGATPFGFAFTPRGALVVSEAGGGPDGTSAVSSYDLEHRTTLDPISASVADTQSAACWIAIGDGGRYAFTTNAVSNSISSYRVHRDGALELIDAATPTVTHPTDEAVDRSGRRLFVVGNGAALQGFDIDDDGALHALTTVAVPTGSTGVAAN